MKMNIPFSPPDITQEEIDEVVDTLKSGWITTGPKTKQLEKLIAEYCHTTKSVCLNSATACLEMTLRLLGIGEGDEVITSVYTYTASASVIHHIGAKIVLVDTAEDSFHIDYDAIADAITEKTRAIIPVDIAGVMCNYNRVFEAVNSKKGLFKPANELQKAIGRIVVIADAAHSFGALYNGEVADFRCFSFHAVKNITTAEGGAVTWRNFPGVDDDEIYKEYMQLTLHGQSKDALAKTKAGAWEYDIVSPAYKCNMTDILASLGLAQLRRYPEILKRRKQIIGIYDAALKDCGIQVLKHYGENYSSSGHLYLVRLQGKDENYRNDVIVKMAESGIATNVHFKPLPMHTAYKNLGFQIKEYPNAFEMYRNEITLPLHTLLTDEEVEYIAYTLREIIAE